MLIPDFKRMKFRSVVEDATKLTPEELQARHTLWRQGDLSWKLKGRQSEIYNEFINQERDVSIALCSRRIGKTTSTLIGCIEVLIQNPFAIIKYACPTQKMVKKMIYPALRVLFFDAPPELALELLWNGTEGELRFPNGSILTIAGTDGNNADNLRGAYAHIVVADEAGFMDNLDYVVRNILLPQLDTTGGKLMMLSTPNYYNPQHEFHKEYVFPAEASGTLIKLTIYDSPMVNDQERQKIINRFTRKEKDPKFLCEYMVEIPTTTESSVIPEFYANKKKIIFDDETAPQMPNYCDFYVSGDIGIRDLTVFLFGYYDFENACLVILDEWEANGLELTTAMMAEAIKEKEKTYFRNTDGQQEEPFKRVMDNELKLINDLKILHGINFFATKKDAKRSHVNKLRMVVGEVAIRIHERCKNLIYHIEHTQWIKGTNEFDHLDESIDGELKESHGDALDALIYLNRNVNISRNPFPYNPKPLNENQHQSIGTRDASIDPRDTRKILKLITGNKGRR